jgi:rod shape-determining protein MreB
MKEPLKELVDSLKDILELMPPDMAGDIVENGVALTGGGSLIRGIYTYLSDAIRLPVYVTEEPLLAVARGTSVALDNIQLLQQLKND